MWLDAAKCEQAIIKTVFSWSDFRLKKKSDVKVRYGLASIKNVPEKQAVQRRFLIPKVNAFSDSLN